MAIKWNNEMLEELVEADNLKEYASKWNMSYGSARNKKKSLLGNTNETLNIEETSNVGSISLSEKLESVNASQISIIPSVILNIDSLIEKGVRFYLADTMNSISTLDKAISDVEHILENQYETLDDATLITLSKNIGILRNKRRIYKNEHEFLDNNRVDCDAFIKFIKEVKNYSQKVCDKMYNTRILKKELGEVHIVNENNSELIYLRGRVKELENIQKCNMDEDAIKRIIALEKFRIKQGRNIKREKGEVVPIDLLVGNWKELFNGMDSETKKGMLKDCYDVYQKNDSIKDKSVADYVVWNEILPNYLYDKKYFIKK